jgi:tetratricopeptide (TPR) repeat protein
VGNYRFVGIALGNLAGLTMDNGNLDKAEQAYEQALKIHRELRNRRFEGSHLCDLGLCLMEQKRLQEGRSRWREGAALLQQLGDSAALERKRQHMRQACAKAGVESFE